MISSDSPEPFDALVIGAGQGGNPLARELAGAGWKTAIVERAEVGGTCINRGCTPTKTMAASARVAYLARRAGDYGVSTGPVEVDMSRVGHRTWTLVEQWRHSNEQRLEAAEGLELIRGEARFVDRRTVHVTLTARDERVLTAPVIVLDTGTRPADPLVPGLAAFGYLDSTTVMQQARVPERMLVLGGGPVGVEFAQMFRRFGSEVTIVQRGRQLLPAEDADVAEALTRILEEDGVTVLLGTRAVEASAGTVRPGEASTARLTVEGPSGTQVLEATHVLAAAGRVPNTEDLDLPAAGVAVDERGFIQVDGHLATTAPGIYAIGDVNGGPAFTHISYDDFRVLRANLLGGPGPVASTGSQSPSTAGTAPLLPASTDGRLVPYSIFTDPQLGRVGLTERQARERGHPVKVARMPVDWIARALETDEPRGLLKAVVDRDTDLILGAAALSIEGGEIMAMLEIAMLGGVRASVLREAVFAHPTLAESLNTLFSSYDE